MGVAYNSSIVTSGLTLYLDAANPKNYNLTAVEVLVVAGGGGGSTAGGGGGGGVLYSSAVSITPGSAITATVGDGGAGTVRSDQGAPTNTSGGNSVFGALTAIGGGRGYFFNGKISVLRIYKGKGLSAAEVALNFNALRGRYSI